MALLSEARRRARRLPQPRVLPARKPAVMYHPAGRPQRAQNVHPVSSVLVAEEKLAAVALSQHLRVGNVVSPQSNLRGLQPRIVAALLVPAVQIAHPVVCVPRLD